ncbi:deoxyribonuclease-1-like 1 [Chelonoidis abingdonii]|uniref:deoxyribonuclease-1-like 1 n=1 Tax=Chelonoidis abingdonii TaxID=106734 RepID=UPI003F493FA2
MRVCAADTCHCRSSRTQVLNSYLCLDENPDRPDAFACEPFVVRFSLPSKGECVPGHLVLLGGEEAEISALYNVFLDVQARWGTEDIMFLGDFNTDCGYVAKKRWGQIQLRREPGFHWLIGDAANTTARNSTHCAYDRIVVHGERCLGLVVPGSAQPFDFPGTFGLTETEALKVSDHYLVEVQLELNAAPTGPCPAAPGRAGGLALTSLLGARTGTEGLECKPTCRTL